MPQLTIGEVARQTDTPASTLRYYESIGLLSPPERVNGRRIYASSIIRQVAAVRRAQDAGWTLSEIKEIIHGFPKSTPFSERWRQMATKKEAELDAIIRQAERAKKFLRRGSECGCDTLDSCDVLGQDYA